MSTPTTPTETSKTFISETFPFSIDELDGLSTETLQYAGFIDEGVLPEEEIELWRCLIKYIGFKLAISNIVVKIETGDTLHSTPNTLADLRKDAKIYRDWAGDLITNIAIKTFKKLNQDELQPLRDYNKAISANEAILDMETQEINRRCFKIELAMHEWRGWSTAQRENTKRILKEFENLGLNAFEIVHKGRGFCLNPSIPTITPQKNFIARFRVYNPGPTAWPPGCYGVPVEGPDNPRSSGSTNATSTVPYSVMPGAQVTLELLSLADSEGEWETAGYRGASWRMTTPGGTRFGGLLYYVYALTESREDVTGMEVARRWDYRTRKPTRQEVDNYMNSTHELVTWTRKPNPTTWTCWKSNAITLQMGAS